VNDTDTGYRAHTKAAAIPKILNTAVLSKLLLSLRCAQGFLAEVHDALVVATLEVNTKSHIFLDGSLNTEQATKLP